MIIGKKIICFFFLSFLEFPPAFFRFLWAPLSAIYVITGGEPVLHQYQYIWTVSLHLFKRIDDAICLGFVLTATWSMMQIASYYLLTAVLPRIGIIMGSDSDLPVMKDAAKILTMFSVPHEVCLM